MKNRCLNPNATDYARYGGKGITVCERWHSFENFLADMGEKPESRFHIHRVDSARPYEPGNCVWLSPTDLMRLHNSVRRGHAPSVSAQLDPSPPGIARSR